jgi:RHS repeat-associated protein
MNMKLSSKHFLLILVLLTRVASAQSAQVATGTPAFGSFGGGPFDTVNLGNLNVHFVIPVVNKAGRGMSFSYNLTYDSSIWEPVTSNGTTSWTNVTDTDWGWTTSLPRVGHASDKLLSFQQVGTCSNGAVHNIPVFKSTYGWVYYDGFGTGHWFPGESWVQSGSPGGACTPYEYGGFTATASDNSGYTITVANGLTVTALTAANGAKINPTSGAMSLQDANGNEITSTISSGTTTYEDTLGQTALTVSGSGTPASPTIFAYTAPSGANAPYTMSYTQYTVQTAFGVSGITEYGPLSNPLVSSIELPDGSKYLFTYEATPVSCTPLSGTTSCVTGRIASVTLPTLGEITYTYSGGNNGIESDGSTAGLTRTLTPGGEWQYSRAPQGSTLPGPGSQWINTVVDPNGNNTLINFSEDNATNSGTTTATYNLYETQRQVYQGNVSTNSCSSTVTNNCLQSTTVRCYNGSYGGGFQGPCPTAAVSSPITQTDTYSELPNNSTRLSQVLYNGNGLFTDDKEYNYGVTLGAAPSSTYLVRETAITYVSLGNNIYNKPSSVKVYDWTSGSQVTLASSSYSYDQTTPTATSGTPQHVSITGSRGNLTTATTSTSSSASFSRTYTYYDTGNPYVATDVNGAQTTYVYGSSTSCGNSFATTINEPLSLSRSMTWNCTGGVATKVTDENGNNVTSNYTDPDFWRPANVYDQENNETTINYIGETAVEAALQNFNSGNSASDFRTTVDGFGRLILSQRLQAPGATNYDTAESDYNNVGQPSRSTMPFSATAGTTNSSAPGVNTTYDALGRVLTTQDADGGTTSYTYTNNDVLQTVSGTQTFQKQLEYDGLGRLTSVCEISSTLPLIGTCGQSNTMTGLWTKYTYDALGHLLTVTQNAQAASGSQQTRSFVYDWMGRMTSESNPETGNGGLNGTITYTWDSIKPCGDGTNHVFAGDLVQKKDNAGNLTCYSYDALHRILSEGNSSVTNTTLRKFIYDSESSYPTGISVSNGKTRMVEATTFNTSNLSAFVTDEFFSYSPRGEPTDAYEATPHSGSGVYYHTTAAYWPTGALQSLSGIPSVPTIYYGANGVGLDGEGRYTQVTAASGTNPVTSVTYSTSSTTNPLGALTGVTFGSADSDSFTYDPNTGRMGTYSFSVNGQTDTGTLHWNTNGTLQTLAIVDNITGTNDTQMCSYQYDDVQRISSSNCGSIWTQNFSYDSFGNITKSGSLTFAPTYSPTQNQFTAIPGVSVSYDANGNLLTDNLNSYTWDPFWGNMLTVNNGSAVVTSTYDALGRMVENNAGGTYTEFVYGPTGVKLATVNGTTLIKAFVALPGGAKAIYNSSGTLAYYRHSDWLGTSRLTSTQARALYSSTAYAPFGEQYATSGSADASFTGQDQDTVSNLYDFPARRQSPSQGRWISPDPAGRGAVTLANPQSWNRYSYVLNNPLALTDPTGMKWCVGDDDDDDDDSVRGRRGGGHAMDCMGDDNDDDDDDTGNPPPNSTCDAQCQAQQAQLAALMAVLTNSDCAALIGGPSAAGQAAVVGDIAGQLFGNPNPIIQFDAGPDSSVPSNAIATTAPASVAVSNIGRMPGVQITLGSNFYNPPPAALGPGFGVAQLQEGAILEEFGHAEGILSGGPGGYAYPSATGIMLDNSTNLSAQSVQNGQNVDATCVNQPGNLPTQASQVDGTIQ